VILLDAYAVIALARSEGAADEVEELVRDGAVVCATNYLETADRLIRISGWSANETSERFALLFGGAVQIRAVDEDIGWRGAVLRARYYDRNSCDLSLADCVLLASAGPDDSVATADPAVAAVARAEGIGLVPLPDSSGQRP
jgi:PIN domain nuclease of toxin-antitoxin system